MLDESVARNLQDRFSMGDRGALGGLYAELRYLGTVAVKAKARRVGIYQEPGEVDRIAHEAASRVIERYLRHDSYSVNRFYVVVRDACRSVTSKREKPTDPIEAAEACEAPAQGGQAVQDPLSEIAATTPFGPRVVVDVARSRSYRLAILTIADYVPKGWIYNHAVQLRTVYRMTRRGKTGCNGVDRRRGVAGDHSTVQALWAEFFQGGQRDAQVVEPGQA